MSMFRKATKQSTRLRMALVGPAGSGKTYSSLVLATHLGGPGARIAVIDTEHGSASKYSDEFTFDVLELYQFDPRAYIDAIQAAEDEGYDVLVIDSLTHAWSGKGGALELVDNAAKRSRSNNTFTAWRDVTPLHNALVDAMLGSRCHVIATMRSKAEYVLEADPTTGKMSPKKLGMAPIQREGMDYEFDVVGDLDTAHTLVIGKTRCKALDQGVFSPPGAKLAATLKNWLTDGATPAIRMAGRTMISPATHGGEPTSRSGSIAPDDVAATAEPAGAGPLDLANRLGLISAAQIAELTQLIADTGMTDVQVRTALAKRGVADVTRLSCTDASAMISNLATILDRKKWEANTFMSQQEWEAHQTKPNDQQTKPNDQPSATSVVDDSAIDNTAAVPADSPPSSLVEQDTDSNPPVDHTAADLAADDTDDVGGPCNPDDHEVSTTNRREAAGRSRRRRGETAGTQ